MKKLFYRLSSSLSFAKLFSLLPIAAFSFFLFSGAAQAQGWGYGPSFSDFGFSGTLQCTAGPFAGTLTPSTTNASETAIVSCTVDPTDPINGQTGTGTFQLFVSYAGIQSSCDNATSVRTYSAFCQATTTVFGNLTWIGNTLSPPEPRPAFCATDSCVLNIGGFPTKNNGTIDSTACSTVFPADAPFADKQVFLFQEFYHGPKCSGSVEPQNEFARYCHGLAFDGSASQCEVKVQNVVDITTGSENTDTGIVVSIDAQPNSINTDCSGNKDNGNATVTIFGSAKFDVSLIDTASLTLNKAQDPSQPKQGTPASSCSTGSANTDNFLDLVCKFATCPLLGPALVQTNGQVVLDGNLSTVTATGTAIHGTDTVKIK